MQKIIGLTGGIGSGKSTLIEFIKDQGYPVYISDKEASKLLNSKEIINKIQFLFQNHVLVVNNLLDKQKLAEVVFNNPKQLQKLNDLIHPLVYQDFQLWVNEHRCDRLLFKESAILFESGAYKQCDYTFLITAPVELRIERVIKRDNISREKVIERMKNQWDDEKKAELANFIIENVDLATAEREILNLINKIS